MFFTFVYLSFTIDVYEPWTFDFQKVVLSICLVYKVQTEQYKTISFMPDSAKALAVF